MRELARLTKRLFLCFDADAAGQDATLRGMELAVAQGFDVKIVPLQPGTDPADDPSAFERQLASPVSYPVHRVRLLHGKAPDRKAAFTAIESFLRSQLDSPEHLEARRLATDLLDLPPETQAALAPRSRSSAAGSSRIGFSMSANGSSAAPWPASRVTSLCCADLELLGPEHFDNELHRRARAYLLGQETADAELTALLAELYALEDEEEITLETAGQLLLRLRERRLERELANADDEHFVELQHALARLRDEIRAFA